MDAAEAEGEKPVRNASEGRPRRRSRSAPPAAQGETRGRRAIKLYARVPAHTGDDDNLIVGRPEASHGAERYGPALLTSSAFQPRARPTSPSLR